jgi:hypothetical protein
LYYACASSLGKKGPDALKYLDIVIFLLDSGANIDNKSRAAAAGNNVIYQYLKDFSKKPDESKKAAAK